MNTWRKVISVVSTIALLLNSLGAPLTVLAQEATPSPTPTDVSTPVPSPTDSASPSASPTAQPTITPDVTPAETATPTPEVTPVATDIVTPAPTDQSVETQTLPASDQPTNSASPTAQPTITPETPSETGRISAAILKDTKVDTTNLAIYDVTYQTDGSATISTDKLDYAPTDSVLISGTGFIAGKTYTINITSSDAPAVNFTNSIKADSSGRIIYSYQLDGNYRPNYQVAIKDLERVVATTTFTDSSLKKDFSQCANDDSPIPSGQCHWIGSALQGTNSNYGEGMTVPQRIIFTDIPNTTGNVHTLTFSHQATKGGTHAYDFLTAYNQSNNPIITLNECNDLAGLTSACNTLHTSSNFSNVDIPDDPFISKDGPTQDRISSYETIYGNRQIKIFANNTITGASLVINSHSVPNNGDTGDSEINYTLTWISASPNILIEMAGHLAIGGNGIGYTWGSGLGSASVSGGPYHIKLAKLDGDAIGSQDNQIQTGAIVLPGNIIINKNTVGADGTFTFTATGGSTVPGGFSIATNGNTGSQTFNNVLAGTYTVTETVPDNGFGFTNLTCSDPSANSSVDLNLRKATIVVAEGETVTCTFTNTQQNGTLRVNKITIPNEAEVFSVTATGSGTITGNATQNVTGGSFVDYTVTTGTYSVTETPKSGWSETGNTCTNVFVPAGRMGECAITNTKKGHIIVDKVTNPSGSTQSFAFTAGGAGYSNFSLTDSAAPNNQELVPGNYSVAETGVPGWDPTNTTCVSSIQDTETSASLELDPGETITCTFTNTQRGNIFGYKYEDANGDGQPGDWTPVVGWVIELWQNNSKVDQTSTIAGGYYEFTNRVLGSYEVKEQADSGWTNITPLALPVTLTAGENDGPNNFVNFNNGYISGHKWNDLNGNGIWDKPDEPAIAGWRIYLDRPQGNDISDLTNASGYYYFGNLGPGTYRVYEEVQNGWAQTAPNGNEYHIQMTSNAAGLDNPNYNFGNQIRGSITIIKNADPNSAQDFSFTTAGTGLSNFSLDDDTDAALSNTKTFPNLAAGRYTVTEGVASGWDLTDISCNQGAQIDMETSTVNLTINQPGENISCTFTNTQRGHLIVHKTTDPQGDQTLFDVEASTNDGEIFGDSTGQISNSTTADFEVSPGTYFVDETLPDNSWQLTQNKCDDIFVGAGETRNCTITNTKLGKIIVRKVTDTEGEDSFEFESDFSGNENFFLSNGGEFDSGFLTPGTYSVSELTPKDWDLTSATCDDQSPVDKISLQAGEIVTCTFNNLKLNPQISITKSNNAGGGISAGSTVTYTLTITNSGNINLNNVLITDFLPGGFTYVNGSTNGATFINAIGPKLTWTVDSLKAHSSAIITYQVTTDSSLTDGDYKNFATCQAGYREESSISCDQVNSIVKIGHGVSYSGSLGGQVLGISTELPATGSPTALLALALGLLTAGFILKKHAKN